jgi:hypothetical protein
MKKTQGSIERCRYVSPVQPMNQRRPGIFLRKWMIGELDCTNKKEVWNRLSWQRWLIIAWRRFTLL